MREEGANSRHLRDSSHVAPPRSRARAIKMRCISLQLLYPLSPLAARQREEEPW